MNDRYSQCRKVFLARLFHETNTFAPGISSPNKFFIKHVPEILLARGDGSMVDAALDEAEKRGWQIIPGPDYRASPGPIVADDVVVDYFKEYKDALSLAIAAGVQAVLLLLHGAMVAESDGDVEGTLLALTRDLLQKNGLAIPVVAVLDPHANVSKTMADNAHCLLAFRENPHTDAVETTRRACGMLDGFIKNKISPRVAYRHAGVVLAPPHTASAEEPLHSLLKIARAHEGGDVLAINICGGFSHADTACCGVTFTIVHQHSENSATLCNAIFEKLTKQLFESLETTTSNEIPVSEAIKLGLAEKKFPCMIVEPADNVGGGAPGDGTWVLRALLEAEVTNAGIIICDPQAVKKMGDYSVGDSIEISIGGWSGELSGGPIKVSARLARRSDGKFTVEDSGSHFVGGLGRIVDMGPSVLLDCSGNKVLVTSNKTMPADLGQWRSVGVNPEELSFIAVKAAIAHKRAYDPIAKNSYTVSTPGCCSSALSALPYKNISARLYQAKQIIL